MTSNPLSIVLPLLFLLIPSAAHPAQDGTIIDFEQAITRTLSDNPTLQARGHALRAQEARILQAGIRPQPQLSVQVQDVFGTDAFRTVKSAETTLSISWILERGVRGNRVDAARAQGSLVQARTDVQRLDAAAETARRYLQALMLQTRMENAREGVRLGEEAVQAIQTRVQAGNAPNAELARARADLARRELAVEDIEHELLSARYRLSAQWGETEPGFMRLIGDILQVPQVSSLQALRRQLRNNPDLAQYLSRSRLDEAQLRLEQARNRRPWQVSAGVRRLEATDDSALVAGFSMPLGRQNSNRGNVEAARAEMARTRQESEAERVRLETELFVIYQELQHGIQLSGVLRDDVLPLYEDALEQTRTAYQQGRYSYLQLNIAQRELLAARYDLIEASAGIYRNLIEIERLTGISIEVPQLSP